MCHTSSSMQDLAGRIRVFLQQEWLLVEERQSQTTATFGEADWICDKRLWSRCSLCQEGAARNELTTRITNEIRSCSTTGAKDGHELVLISISVVALSSLCCMN